MAESTFELLLNGLRIEDGDLELIAECEEIAAVEAESRHASEAMAAEPSTASLTTLPLVEFETTSITFEA